VQSQQNQARAVYATGLSSAYANDLIDGGGRLRSGLLDAPTGGAKAATMLSQQQAKNAELSALFDKSNPSSSVTLGKSTYSALPPPDSNISGTTKTFNTLSLSNSVLQKDVMDYAQQLAGGKAITPHPTAKGIWNVKLDDGTTINVRSESSSQVSRWTIDVQQSPALSGLKASNKYEVKFK
jgi:hypothetical protein